MTLRTASNRAASSSDVCSTERRAGASTLEMIEDIFVKLKQRSLDLALKCAVVSPSLTIACCIKRVIANYGGGGAKALRHVKKIHGRNGLDEKKRRTRSFF